MFFCELFTAYCLHIKFYAITIYCERDARALQELFSKYIAEEFLPWVKTFPDDFYIQMFRLRGWDYKGRFKTPYAGQLTNFLVYNRLPDGILDGLKRLNPVLNKNGYRKYKLFQGLFSKYLLL